MTMIERVARAMQKVDGQSGTCYELTDIEAIAFARAAIEAMREATDAMVEAGWDANWIDGPRTDEHMRDLFAAMTDAALAEEV